MKLKAYKAWTDGDSGEWGREYLGCFYGETSEEILTAASNKSEWYEVDIRLFPIGERVKLHGYLSDSARADCLRDEFNAMCHEEKNAYFGF